MHSDSLHSDMVILPNDMWDVHGRQSEIVAVGCWEIKGYCHYGCREMVYEYVLLHVRVRHNEELLKRMTHYPQSI